MKAVYCVLSTATALALLATPSFAIDIRVDSPVGQVPPSGAATGFACDEGALDSAFYQGALTAWGNAFDVGAGGPLSTLDFWHFGYGFPGPYDYNIRIYDEATCTEICMIPGLVAADAATVDANEVLDLCDLACSVSGRVVIGLEPLSCLDPTDCYPDLRLDNSGVINFCARGGIDVNAPAGCDVPLTAGDFVQRITVDECGTVPTVDETWSGVKNLYR